MLLNMLTYIREKKGFRGFVGSYIILGICFRKRMRNYKYKIRYRTLAGPPANKIILKLKLQ